MSKLQQTAEGPILTTKSSQSQDHGGPKTTIGIMTTYQIKDYWLDGRQTIGHSLMVRWREEDKELTRTEDEAATTATVVAAPVPMAAGETKVVAKEKVVRRAVHGC